MKVRVEERGPIICDTGPNEGLWRVDLAGSVYLDDGERAVWERAGRLSVQLLVPLDGGGEDELPAGEPLPEDEIAAVADQARAAAASAQAWTRRPPGPWRPIPGGAGGPDGG